MNDLIISNLKVSYGNNKILEKFNLKIDKNKLFVILGPSGCGKSTLLSAISGLKEPDKGIINFNRTCLFNKVMGKSVPVEERNIGFIFQTYALWPHMNVYKNIAYPLKIRNYNKQIIKDKVADILDKVNMNGYENRFPNNLSGGEKQRIALARALVYQPSLLLLDEPLANLDANLKTHLIHQIKTIQQKMELTMIYVTHDQKEAFELADEIVIMNEGKILQKGKPREVYANSKNKFVAKFLGDSNVIEKNTSCYKMLIKKDSDFILKDNQLLLIRPEHIILSGNGKYVGIINQIVFKGEHTRYLIKYKDEKLIVFSKYINDLRIGYEIKFNIFKFSKIKKDI